MCGSNFEDEAAGAALALAVCPLGARRVIASSRIGSARTCLLSADAAELSGRILEKRLLSLSGLSMQMRRINVLIGDPASLA